MLALGMGGDEDPIEAVREDDLPTVQEAKAKPASREDKPESAIRKELFEEAGIADSKTPKEAADRFKKFANAMRARGLVVDKPAFEKWSKEKFGA